MPTSAYLVSAFLAHSIRFHFLQISSSLKGGMCIQAGTQFVSPCPDMTLCDWNIKYLSIYLSICDTDVILIHWFSLLLSCYVCTFSGHFIVCLRQHDFTDWRLKTVFSCVGGVCGLCNVRVRQTWWVSVCVEWCMVVCILGRGEGGMLAVV